MAGRKVATNRTALLDGLKVVGAVSMRPGTPVSAGVLIEASGSKVTMTATDLEMTVRHEVTLPEPIGTFKVLAPRKVLADICKAAPDAGFQVSTDGKQLTVGYSVIRLLPVEDFPVFSEVKAPTRIFNLETWRDAATVGASCVSDDADRPILTSVRAEFAEGVLTIASTDSYTLAVATCPKYANHGSAKDFAVNMLGDGVAAVLKLTRKAPADWVLAIRPSKSETLFAWGQTELRCRNIEGEFPNYRQLLPDPDGRDKETGKLLAGKLMRGPEFDSTIASVGVLARNNSPVRLELGSEVAVCASSPDLGMARAVVDDSAGGTRWEGEPLTVAFNPRYLARALEMVPDAPVRIRDGLRPMTVGDADRCVLVMPVRLPAPIG